MAREEEQQPGKYFWFSKQATRSIPTSAEAPSTLKGGEGYISIWELSLWIHQLSGVLCLVKCYLRQLKRKSGMENMVWYSTKFLAVTWTEKWLIYKQNISIFEIMSTQSAPGIGSLWFLIDFRLLCDGRKENHLWDCSGACFLPDSFCLISQLEWFPGRQTVSSKVGLVSSLSRALTVGLSCVISSSHIDKPGSKPKFKTPFSSQSSKGILRNIKGVVISLLRFLGMCFQEVLLKTFEVDLFNNIKYKAFLCKRLFKKKFQIWCFTHHFMYWWIVFVYRLMVFQGRKQFASLL